MARSVPVVSEGELEGNRGVRPPWLVPWLFHRCSGTDVERLWNGADGAVRRVRRSSAMASSYLDRLDDLLDGQLCVHGSRLVP